MLVKSPLILSPGFLDAFGYRHGPVLGTVRGRGVLFGRRVVRQPELRLCLYANGFNLGSSAEPATAWLLADRLTGVLYVGPKNEVHAVLLEQQFPDENKTHAP